MYQKNIITLLTSINNTIHDLKQIMWPLSHFSFILSLLLPRLYSACLFKKRHVSASN